MADTKSYNNRYRKYLEDDADTYLNNPTPTTTKFIMGSLATVGLAAGGVLAFNSGKMSGMLRDTIMQMGKYRQGKAVYLNNSLRRYSESEGLGGFGKAIRSAMRGETRDARKHFDDFVDALTDLKPFKEGLAAHEKSVRDRAGSKLRDNHFELEHLMSSSTRIQEELEAEGVGRKHIEWAQGRMEQYIIKHSRVDPKHEALTMHRMGVRHATVQDLLNAGERLDQDFVQRGKELYQRVTGNADDFLKSRVDRNIMVDMDGNLADLRDFRKTFIGFMESLTTDFTIPLIKINPLRMFYLDQLFSTVEKPHFHVTSYTQRNPAVTGHAGSAKVPYLFMDGKVFEMPIGDAGAVKRIEGEFFLADAQKGPLARLMRNVAGMTISKYNTPDANTPFLTRLRYNFQSMLGLGLQDEPGGQFDIFDMTSYGQSAINFFTGKLKFTDLQMKNDMLKDAFGDDARFFFMRKTKKLGDVGIKEFMGQFFAGRRTDPDDPMGLKNFTFASVFPYGFFERLNATLNQVNLGLPNADLGSALDIFKNLTLKRVFPIVAGYELWEYLNYETENFTDEQLSDRFAKAYANTSVELAKLRDKLGITDWAKGVRPLFVGGEQLAEFPGLGRLVDLDDTAEETADWWQNGEVAVRKGRWWPLGNTPYTGGKIEYYQPNWVRRVLADAKFSDAQYGSREEYFQNSWMPTPRHPFAPIRHFFTDPYHWEEKHYDDRPFMVTGGIPEIENFPLIGPLLHKTIGQVLKPEKKMHPEYWAAVDTPGQYNPEVASFAAMPELTPSLTREITQSMSPIPGFKTPERGNPILQVPVPPADVIPSIPNSDGPLMPPQLPADVMFTSSYDYDKVPDDVKNAWIAMYNHVRQTVPMYVVTPDNLAPLLMQYQLPLDHVIRGLQNGGSPVAYNTPNGKFIMMSRQYYYGIRPDERQQILDHELFHQVFNTFYPNDPRLSSSWRTPEEHVSMEAAAHIGAQIVRPQNFNHGLAEGVLDTYRASHGFDQVGRKSEILDHFMDVDQRNNEWFTYAFTPKEQLQNAPQGVGKAIAAYVTSSGQVQILSAKNYQDVIKAAEHLDESSPARSKGIRTEIIREPDDDVPLDQPIFPGSIQEAIGNLHYNMSEMGGFYGFMGTSITGEIFSKSPQWQSSSDMTSYSRAFWDLDIGGFGGDANEIFRRFLPKDRKINEVNPIRNTMPYWLPGDDYFIDFQHGDPYSKVKKGEIRLPGEAYERMYGIRAPRPGEQHGDQYGPIDRFRILSDVAPYSREYRELESQFKFMDLSKEEKKEIQRIKQRVSERKERLRLYPYRFTTANLENEFVTVDQVIDQNTFTTLEHPNNPIRLAGLRVPTGKDDPVALRAQEVIERTIRPGKRIKIAYDADEQNRVKDDTYKTIQSVVYDAKNRNLNHYLIEQGLAKEKDNDYSPAAVHARFTDRQIAFGSLWEKFAHLDTIVHTKFLQVRSPLESYERREVYGKDWQEWTDPVQDYLIPAIQNGMVHHPLYAIAAGGFLGAAFGSLKMGDLGYDGTRVMNRYGKVVGGVLGASVMGGAVMYRMLYEHIKGEAWIPERRKKERDTEEYFDILKYIKYNSLYEKYAELAMKQEHFDVEKFLSESKMDGEMRKKRIEDLNRVKRQMYVSRQSDWPKIQEMLRELGIDAENRDEAFKKLNAEINSLTTHRELHPMSPLAAQAIMYKQATKKTLYGYEAGDPMADVLSALPKKDRDYLIPFIESPEEERPRILQIVPNYMKRILQSAWGMPVDQKQDLETYFREHPLPGKKWKGWNENVSIDDIKVKFVDRVGLDPSEFDIWPADRQRADRLDVPVPNVFKGRETADSFAGKLRDILHGKGLDGVSVEVIESSEKGIHVDLDLEHDRRDDFKRLVNSQGQYVI